MREVIREEISTLEKKIEAKDNTPLVIGDRLLNISDVADRLGCSRPQVYKYLDMGLKTVRFGKSRRKVRESDLNLFIRRKGGKG
ncbi:MAG: helix-turn-helix domain-containing protein [Cytophagales bacterium]|nr:helix-turn-helix domain-containing protein [Cytophagales bacterium]